MRRGRWLTAAWGANLRSAMERRGAFLAQAVLMAVNNFVFLSFWALFFGRFPSVNGWKLADVALLFGLSAAGFGLSVILFGGTLDLSRRIAEGTLDTWLLRPRPAWLQAASSRMRLSGWGDLASGVLLFVLASGPEAARLAVFCLGVVVAATGFTAFFVLAHCLAFWSGRSEEASQQGVNALITFSLYPPGLFGGKARLLLHTVVPAGFVSWAPASLVREWSWAVAGQCAVGVAALVVVAALAWRRGLARYEGGSLLHAG